MRTASGTGTIYDRNRSVEDHGICAPISEAEGDHRDEGVQKFPPRRGRPYSSETRTNSYGLKMTLSEVRQDIHGRHGTVLSVLPNARQDTVIVTLLGSPSRERPLEGVSQPDYARVLCDRKQ